MAHTPWGASQYSKELKSGMVFHGTASHGGLKIDRARNAKIPQYLRREGGWYEEDCEFAIPVVIFKDEFENDPKMVEDAIKTMKNHFYKGYEKLTGETVKPEESSSKREIIFWESNRDNMVGISATRQDDGTIIVSAALGGRALTPPYTFGPTTDFIVSKEDYAKRAKFGYVIDPIKDLKR